jgi:hypothetical protein
LSVSSPVNELSWSTNILSTSYHRTVSTTVAIVVAVAVVTCSYFSFFVSVVTAATAPFTKAVVAFSTVFTTGAVVDASVVNVVIFLFGSENFVGLFVFL